MKTIGQLEKTLIVETKKVINRCLNIIVETKMDSCTPFIQQYLGCLWIDFHSLYFLTIYQPNQPL